MDIVLTKEKEINVRTKTRNFIYLDAIPQIWGKKLLFCYI